MGPPPAGQRLAAADDPLFPGLGPGSSKGLKARTAWLMQRAPRPCWGARANRKGSVLLRGNGIESGTPPGGEGEFLDAIASAGNAVTNCAYVVEALSGRNIEVGEHRVNPHASCLRRPPGGRPGRSGVMCGAKTMQVEARHQRAGVMANVLFTEGAADVLRGRIQPRSPAGETHGGAGRSSRARPIAWRRITMRVASA